MIEDFLKWIASPSGKDSIYGWVLGTIVFGGALALILKTANLSYGYATSRMKFDKKFSSIFGVYFVYNPPLIPSISQIPRASMLKIHRGLVAPAKVTQWNIEPSKEMYTGEIIAEGNSFYIYLDSSEKNGDKFMVVFEYRVIGPQRYNTFVGLMAGINLHGEPFHVPVIITQKPLNVETVNSVLEKIGAAGSPITRAIYRQTIDELDRADEATDESWFEYPIGKGGPLPRKKHQSPGIFFRASSRIQPTIGDDIPRGHNIIE